MDSLPRGTDAWDCLSALIWVSVQDECKALDSTERATMLGELEGDDSTFMVLRDLLSREKLHAWGLLEKRTRRRGTNGVLTDVEPRLLPAEQINALTFVKWQGQVLAVGQGYWFKNLTFSRSELMRALPASNPAHRPPKASESATRALINIYPQGAPSGKPHKELAREVNAELSRLGEPSVSIKTVDRVWRARQK